MNCDKNTLGVCIPKILLPANNVDLTKWACVACDQYTSEHRYWDDVYSFVGDSPSSLHLMLPEIYLNQSDLDSKINRIHQKMDEYLSKEILIDKGEGIVYIERVSSGRKRKGLIIALDLEQYDYTLNSDTLIRATEFTIVERIPPRLKVRRNASLEMPHIIVLIDDPNHTIIEPLATMTPSMTSLYDFNLMKNGGHLQGWMIQDAKQIESILSKLHTLANKGSSKSPFLFAIGDGNHSIATAKSAWEETKKALTEEERLNHPARFCLVEIENLYDTGIIFEPIHRIIFPVEPTELLSWLEHDINERNSHNLSQEYEPQTIPYISSQTHGSITVQSPTSKLTVKTLQDSLDRYLLSHPGVSIDYIHGENVAYELGRNPKTVAFLLPGIEKSDLFKSIISDGVLPRKTFSMGEANEKRFYMECRKIK